MIKLKNVNFAYPGADPLLQDVNVTFPRGKVTTILGPNGSGKSTLLKLASHLLTATEGEVLLEEQDIKTMKRKAVAGKISMLSQSHQPPELEVGELVSFGRYPYKKYGQSLSKEDEYYIEEAMKKVDITQYRHRMVNKLSGGERQRAYIAMALAQNTEMIVLDEPTTYLDIHIRYELMDLIRELNQQGKSIVMVLHDLDLALKYSDYLILMEEGKIVTTGSPKELVASGEIERVFRIKIRLLENEKEVFYCFSKKA